MIDQYASTPEYSSGAGERFYYLAPYFAEAGFEVEILSGSYNHLFITYPKTPKLFNVENIPGGIFHWVRLRRYKGESLSGRLLSWFEFLVKLFFFKIKQPPRIVVVSSMSLFPFIYGYYLKKRYGAKLILEIKDIWPLTIVDLGGNSPKHPFVKLLGWLEKFAYKKADMLVSVMPDLKRHVKETINMDKEVCWIPNAISVVEGAEPEEKNTQVPVLDPNKFNVIYTGKLGVANAMEYVVRSAKYLKDIPQIMITIVGEGPDKEGLMKIAEENGLTNVKFLPKVKKPEVQKILLQADCCIISWRNRKIYSYGVSANKYNDYMLAGKPMISASSIFNDPVTISGAGLQVEPENAEKIAAAIVSLFAMNPDERKAMGSKGTSYVMSNQTYNRISKSYIGIFNRI